MTKKYSEVNDIAFIDYKDIELLSKFVNPHGRIIARKHTGLTAKKQKQIEKAIKRARFLALMPYIKY